MDTLAEEVRRLSEESKAIRDTVSGALAPIKAYHADLFGAYMKWREAHEGAIQEKLNRLQKLTESASASGEWLRARIREKKSESGDPVTVNALIEKLRKARAGDLAKKLQGLRAEWNSVVEAEHAGAEQAKHKLRIHLQDKAEVAGAEAKKSAKEGEKASAQLKKSKEKGVIDEAAQRLVAKFAAEQKKQEEAEKAMSEAASKLGGKSKASVTAELEGDADHALDIFSTAGASVLEALDSILAEVEAFVGQLQEAADDMPEDAPAEEEVEVAPEQPAEEAPAEAPSEELVPAGASLHSEAGDAEVAEVEKLEGDMKKMLGKIEHNAQQRHTLKGMKQAIDLKPRAPDTSKEKAPDKEPGKMTKDEKELRLHEIKKQRDEDRGKIKELKSKLEGEMEKLLKSMEKHGVDSLELKGQIDAKIIDIKEEEQKALEKAHKQDIQNIQTNADSFQEWLARCDKVTDHDNAILVAAIEALESLQSKVDKQLSIEKSPRSLVPEEVVEETEKGLDKYIKKQKETPKKKTSLDGVAIVAGEAVDELEASIEEISAIAEESESFDEYDALSADLKSLDFEASPAEGAEAPADEAPGEEGPGWLDQMMPAPSMEMAPAPASMENPWLKEADMKEYPSEHDVSTNRLDLVETVEADGSGEGKAELVVRKDVQKDLKSRVDRRINEMHKGAFRPGQTVAIDLGGIISEGNVVKYSGNRKYEVSVNGETIEVAYDSLFSVNSDLWR
jgi:hypothetical protein